MLPTPHLKSFHVPLGSTGVKPQIPPRGLREGPSRKVACQKAQLNCLYTDACSMGNKQEELETVTCLQNYDLDANTQKRWDYSHN